ncbi:MAG: ABC transporter substrate-binding protein [Spirochaetales bacterium]|nr:ABC transporter substrate-binding protein [Spirochaetales bacterium]
MKKILILTGLLILIAMGIIIFQFLQMEQTKPDNIMEEKIIIGFSQIGAESAWRNRNSESIKNAATSAGVQLLFKDAEQKQENQIQALRSFIAYQVDVIAFVPIVETGWDNILREARAAGIPVLITDRKIKTSEEKLYAGFIGTDSEEEGRNAAKFLLKKFSKADYPDKSKKNPIRIVEIRGTEGSSPAEGRTAGFRQGLEGHQDFKIIYSTSGDFLRSKGYEIMSKYLDKNKKIDVIYSHNDGMTLGIIDAIHEHGLLPGKDIVIVTIDAEQAAIDALKKGEINCVLECNPNTGPDIMSLSKKLANGESIPRFQHVHEEVFTEYDDLSSIAPRGY